MVALADNTGIVCLIDQFIFDQLHILDIDSQAGEAIFHGVDIILATETIYNRLCILGTDDRLDILLHLRQIIFTARVL